MTQFFLGRLVSPEIVGGRLHSQGMPLITLEKPGVESTGRLAEGNSSQARQGNRRVWDLTAQARERHLGALSCKENPASGTIPQPSGGWGSRLFGLPTAASRSKDLAPYPDPGSGPLSTPLAHLRSPDSTRPQASAHPGGRPWPTLSEAGQAVPHDTPGSAFPCRHSGARPRRPASRCC